MPEIIRPNIDHLPYSLHDRRVCAMEISGDSLTLRFSDGITKIGDPCELVDGHIRIDGLDWDFCHAYIMDIGFDGTICSGRRMPLADFISSHPQLNFEIVDETYGYNRSVFDGYLSIGSGLPECRIEIYHFGPMRYIAEK